MISTQALNLDVSRRFTTPEQIVYAKQNDSNSRQVTVTLFENGNLLSELTTNGRAYFGLPNKTKNVYIDVTITNGVTSFIIPQNALSNPGYTCCEIEILSSDDTSEVLTSASFKIYCDEQINPESAIIGENDGNLIENIVNEIVESQLDSKVDKVEGKGLSTNDYTDAAKSKLGKIGNTDNIPSTSRYIVNWIQDNYDKVFTSGSDYTCVADRVAAQEGAASSLQSQIDEINTNAFDQATNPNSLAAKINNNTAKISVIEDELGEIPDDKTVQGQIDELSNGKVGQKYNGGTGEIFNNYANNVASGSYSHAEGNCTTTIGVNSHAEGKSTNKATTVITDLSSSTTNDDIIAAWGTSSFSLAKGNASSVSGLDCLALGNYSHAEGNHTTASGTQAHAEGYFTTASGESSHACGVRTTAAGYQFVAGKYNAARTGVSSTESQNASQALFSIGYGTSSASGNAFTIYADGTCKGVAAFEASGADYAEYFEWADGNPDGENRVGRFVTLDGDKIRIANSDDGYILGVVSGSGSFIGNAAGEEWQGKYLTDVYGTRLTQTVEIPEHTDEETGETVPAVTVTQYVLNPEYDPTVEYIPRASRKEWAAVGMLGQLTVTDDGTCTANGYCKVSNDGTATAADSGYRILKRLDDTLVSILYR